MNGPRLTEERLRHHLDGNQPAREGMCLALLPILGPFTDCTPRRPKGGPDGARDIECLYKGIQTWGAVGFRNGGGRDAAARKAAQSKFRQDLDTAFAENPSLKSFVFFTNVDLTPEQKSALQTYSRKRGITTVHVFDLEILRNSLDSRDGLLFRQQYLDISANGTSDDWKSLQSSKISSYHVPLRLRLNVHGKVDENTFDTFTDALYEWLGRSFAHTCLTTPFDDFVFILSLEPTDGEEEPGYRPFLLSIHCHITAFVWAFQEFCQCFLEGSTERVSARLRTLPGSNTVDAHVEFGHFVPHRIFFSGAKQISIQAMTTSGLPLDRTVTTSTLLRLLAKTINSPIMIWDDADQCPDFSKILHTLGKIHDAGGAFIWDHFHVNRDNPESWEFIGMR